MYHRHQTLSYRSLVFAFALLLALCGRAIADKVLLIHNDSLTTYLPTSKTPVQDVRPSVLQRSTSLEGHPRFPRTTIVPPGSGGIVCGMMFDMTGYDASEGRHRWLTDHYLGTECPTCDPKDSTGGVDLLGTYAISDIDMELPASGFSWIIGRTYNTRQKDNGGSYFKSTGYQGNNWFQSSQPELIYYDHPSDPSRDMLYLVLGADRFVEFKRWDETRSCLTAPGVGCSAGS